MRRYAPWIVIAVISWGIYSLRENAHSRRTPSSYEFEDLLQSVSDSQAEGLKNSEVIVHRVYPYEGHTWVEPTEELKLIAVDVEFRKYRIGLDLDDVDIMNGETDENYGSWPDIVRLNRNGTIAENPDDATWPEGLGPLRVLLIYQFPKESKTIKLGYWGQLLTPTPVPIAGDGPQVPKPAPEKNPREQ